MSRFVEGPMGGSNQFLTLLRKELKKRGLYSEFEQADVVIFDSCILADYIVKLKWKFPKKIFIHRVDGPIRLYNVMSDTRDLVVYLLDEKIADGTVFQTHYSMDNNIKMGMKRNECCTVINNASDRDIFYKKRLRGLSSRKPRIIATSWSLNINKGFDTYKYLDNNIDFSKYEMCFIGNSPVAFKNITMKAPMKSEELAEELRNADIYISASKKEPCSNAIIEAMNCGLPVICRNDGGNSEIVSDKRFLFDYDEQILDYVDQIIVDYIEAQSHVIPPNLDNIIDQYIDFCQMVKESKREDEIKRITLVEMIYIRIKIWMLQHK